jgi:heme exporter protein D
MTWGGTGNFWAMGGYGLYVWGSYGLMLLVFVIEIISLRARRKAALTTVARRVRASSVPGGVAHEAQA